MNGNDDVDVDGEDADGVADVAVQDSDDPRYQEDQLLLQGGAGAAGGPWTGTAYSSSSTTKTSQRTYTDSDGTQVTEVVLLSTLYFSISYQSRHQLLQRFDTVD